MIEVALGAGLGASVRYLMTQVLKSRTRVFPWATFNYQHNWSPIISIFTQQNHK